MKTALCLAILAISSLAVGQQPSNAQLQSIIAQQQQDLAKITRALQTVTEILKQQDEQIEGLRSDLDRARDDIAEFKAYFYTDEAGLMERMRQIEDWHAREPVKEDEKEDGPN